MFDDRFRTAGEGNDQESVAGASDGNPIMSSSPTDGHGISEGGLVDSGEGYQSAAGVLAGGDGSARKKRGIINGSYDGGCLRYW